MADTRPQCKSLATLCRALRVSPVVCALLLAVSRAHALPPQERATATPSVQCPTCDELSTLGIRGTETLSVVGEHSRADAAVLFGFYNHAYRAYGLASSRTF